MNISASSASSAKLCWRKTFNNYHRGFTQGTYALSAGGAMHAGVAHGLATKDWAGALEIADKEFTLRTQEQGLCDELDFIHVSNRELVGEMVKAYQRGFDGQNIQVIQPEVHFNVPISGSSHNCIFHHWEELNSTTGEWEERWSDPSVDDMVQHKRMPHRGPSAEAILERRVRSPHDWLHGPPEYVEGKRECKCWQPHRIVGTTDALAMWNRALWLLEHKSTAIEGEQFWAGFRIDLQPTVYLYGVWKSLGVLPAGVVINAIRKPTESQVAAWNSKRKNPREYKQVKDYITYSREAFIREEKHMVALEQDLLELCQEWEERVLNGRFPQSNVKTICLQYNRPCQFFSLCTSLDDSSELLALQEQAEAKQLVQIQEGEHDN